MKIPNLLPILISEIEYIIGPNKILCPIIKSYGDNMYYKAKVRDKRLNYSYISTIGLENLIERAKELKIKVSIDFSDNSINFFRFKY
jgi:hypothetical protein